MRDRPETYAVGARPLAEVWPEGVAGLDHPDRYEDREFHGGNLTLNFAACRDCGALVIAPLRVHDDFHQRLERTARAASSARRFGGAP